MLKLPKDEYTVAYRQRLDDAGVQAIAAELDAVRELRLTDHPDVGGLPIVLLCFERLNTLDRQSKQPTWCHRTMFRTWWEERTGDVVPEYGAVPTHPAAAAAEPRLF